MSLPAETAADVPLQRKRSFGKRNEVMLNAGLLATTLPIALLVSVQPLLAGVLMEAQRLSSLEIGLLFSLQALVGAVLAPLVGARLTELRVDWLASAGILVWSLGFSVPLLSHSLLSTVASMLLSGAAIGLLVVASGAGIASARHPAAVAALQAVVAAVGGAGFTLLESVAIYEGGMRGAFAMLAALVVLLPLCLLLPGRTASAFQAPGSITMVRSPLVVASFIAATACSGVWLFAERIGVSIGMSEGQVANVLAATALAGIAGGAASVALGNHRGLRWMTAAICCLLCLAAAGVALARGGTSFTIGISVLTFLYLMYLPVTTTLAVRWDPTGALAGAVGAAITLASAVAPTLTGSLVRGGTYGTLSWFALGCAVLAPLALMQARRQGDLAPAAPAKDDAA